MTSPMRMLSRMMQGASQIRLLNKLQFQKLNFTSLASPVLAAAPMQNGVNYQVQHSRVKQFHTGCPCCAAQVCHAAPDFKGMAVSDGQFKQIQLSDYKGKYLVLFFYPLDFTFVCPTEIIAFSNRMNEFKELNAEVVGVSTDSHFSHLAWINMSRKDGGLGGLNYPLLSDYNKNIANDYGVLLEEPGIALRGLFIIDTSGTVRQITINDLPVGRSVDETIRLIQAFQFVEKHGEVCPANWKPNSPTIKPSPEDSKEYFEKTNK